MNTRPIHPPHSPPPPPRAGERFDPDGVPNLVTLLDEIDDYDTRAKAEARPRRLPREMGVALTRKRSN